MAKYDVGIVGLWSGCNYGSIATYYALNQVVSSMGKSVLMIDKPILTENDIELKETHSRIFGKKHYNISKQYRLNELNVLNDICDTFIIGSDQVWNYGISKNFGNYFYFDFVNDDKKKIAYAVSFGHGVDFAPPEKREEIAKYMSRFDGISTREADGVRLCKDAYGVNAQQVLDPVFLADPVIYTPLINESKHHEDEPFLLTYILDPTPEKREAILHLSKQLGNIKIINMLDGLPWTFEKNKKLIDLPNCIPKLTVEDWLYYISHSRFLLTDSCHGASFALIFKKDFIAITNKHRGISRFKSLSELFHVEDRVVSDPKDILTNPSLLDSIDYAPIEKIMKSERKRCNTWLENKFKIANNVKIKAITKTLDIKKCIGCGACVSLCPVDALSLCPDDLGYYRSTIDNEKCINCGKCTNICPALTLPLKKNSSNPELYEFVVRDRKILFNSSSGGVFPMLVAETFKKCGVVFGAAWCDDFSVEHIMIDSPNDLHKLQKSKYLQSYLGDTFRKVKEKLDNNIFVLFSGCPCQAAGLRAFLDKDYDNLIIVDLLCGNAPSTMFFRKYIEEAFPDGLKKYEFRHKAQSWNSDCIKITTAAGITSVKKGGKQDSYQRAYHPHIMCAPHCEKCSYQSVPRYGDITIGDFWGLRNKDNSLDVSGGVSAVLCNNEKGKLFFDSISEEFILIKKKVPLNWLGGNGYAINGSHNSCSPYRNDFYKAIRTMTFTEAINYAVKPDHGIKQHSGLFDYNSKVVHFSFDSAVWCENYINGATILSTKMPNPKAGKYASLPIYSSIKAGVKYIFKVRFKISTDSPIYNFHIKSAGESIYQVIYSHKITLDNSVKWVEVSKEFIADSDIYDEFMIGAAQLRGDNRWIAVDYVSIEEDKND